MRDFNIVAQIISITVRSKVIKIRFRAHDTYGDFRTAQSMADEITLVMNGEYFTSAELYLVRIENPGNKVPETITGSDGRVWYIHVDDEDSDSQLEISLLVHQGARATPL